MKKETGPDVAELVAKMQERMVIMERKIDILISRIPARHLDVRPPQQPQPRPQGNGNMQQNQQHQHQNQQPQQQQRKDKVMHKAICADCKKDCEVPFVPTENRPVYCKECYSRRRAGGGPVKVEAKVSVPGPKPEITKEAPAPAASKKAATKKPAAKKAKPEKKKAAPKKKKKN